MRYNSMTRIFSTTERKVLRKFGVEVAPVAIPCTVKSAFCDVVRCRLSTLRGAVAWYSVILAVYFKFQRNYTQSVVRDTSQVMSDIPLSRLAMISLWLTFDPHPTNGRDAL